MCNSFDNNTLFGRYPHNPNIYYSVAYNANGIAKSSVAAKALVELFIEDEKKKNNLSSPKRSWELTYALTRWESYSSSVFEPIPFLTWNWIVFRSSHPLIARIVGSPWTWCFGLVSIFSIFYIRKKVL